MSFGGADAEGLDPEIRRALEVEQAKARFQSQIHSFTDLCWDACIDKPSAKLDSKTENCLMNCVERYIDSNLMLANRFADKMKRMSSN
ncbi:uncharacterized protein TRIADDRAFT_24994 [Trichoplax adhaerens]|uniref:Mitochondrial import inner membrane translocase subunit n=1 Tax=Trichoplax adhaerens TaxID=10228 RepID=B3RXF1_TRIAD|nr:hypothetical protein TRIADDRAFT_24994 [Trichoplax adhaerens]EDV24410.1 hypothetical protein TRIADDRAFT_24994 [Trichoplax adhaerens]|eukprot:XP_002112300.1 hypothetical protein TRIADDRAFT_24994 [Trichoplax adhaerens]